MKRSLLLFLLATGCFLSSGCRAKDQAAGGAGNARSVNGGDAAGAKAAKTDVVFARETVEGLFGGDVGVADAFDWENLKVPGMDVGESYREMPEDENPDEVRKEFIDNFSESFKQSGASVGDLKNWREQSKEGERTIVAVDTTTGKTMHVTVVRRDGRQLVSDLSIE
jgi:hypothetical protein